MRIISGIIITILFFSCSTLSAQSEASTYSFYGLGELSDNSLAHNEAMGGLGVGIPGVFNINIKNSAWLTYNSLSSFNVGIKGEFRSYNSEAGSGTGSTGSIRYMVLSVPVMNGRWGSAVSMLPYSSVNYGVASIGEVDNAPDREQVANFFTGSGGLTQLAWSNGFRLFGNTNVGVKAAYVFGSINKSISNAVGSDTAEVSYFTEFKSEDSYNDILLSLAFGQRIKMGENRFLNIGLTYEHSGKLNGTSNTWLQRLSIDRSTSISSNQINDETPISYDLPAKIKSGISYQMVDKYKVGLDMNYGNWESSTNISNAELRNTLEIILGAAYTPDFRDVNSYLKRVTYRFGVNYKQLPYIINETDVNEFGINFGASFPTNGVSSVDAAFKFGLRGTIENNLVSERFFQIVLGMSINERWFVKRRYD